MSEGTDADEPAPVARFFRVSAGKDQVRGNESSTTNLPVRGAFAVAGPGLNADDGALVNLGLIRDGYAEAVVLEPNVLWAAEVEAAEDAAQAASRGIWGAC